MYVWLRLLRILVASRWRRHLGPLDASVLRFRSGLSDMDYNLHVNNARFLAIMDLGRYDLMARLGLVRLFRRNRWMPVVAAAAVRFAKPVGLWRRFELHTRVLGWDQRWVYLEQSWVRNGAIVCLAWLKTGLRGPAGVVPPAALMEAAGFDLVSPAIPDGVAAWGAAEASGPVRGPI